MRKNGKNIITDGDITLSGVDAGENLSTVLSRYKNKLDQLESNIKWIYKNGGIGAGSGSGSGSSSSTSWKIVVTKDSPTGDILVNNSNVNLGGIANYVFCVQIYGGGQSSFKVTSSYTNSKGNQVTNNIITSSDGFLWQKNMYLDINGKISITVLNQDTQEVNTFVIPYIVTSHSFYLSYVYADSKMEYSPSNNTIFMNDIKTQGIQAALTYSVSVELLNSGYSYQDWEGNTWRVSATTGMTKTTPTGVTTIIYRPEEIPEDKLIREKSTNTIYIDLTTETDILKFLGNNDNARYTQFILNLDITLGGNQEPENLEEMSLKDNLIPAGMYLKLTTAAGTLYENRQLSSDQTLSYPSSGQFSLGSAIFVLTPYYGALDTTRRYNLLMELGTSPSDLQPIDSNITQLSDQTQQAPSIPITSSGEHYVKFTITSEGTSYSVGYYFFVKESTSSFNWMPTDIEPVLSSYYRRYDSSKGVSISHTKAINQNINNTTNIECVMEQNRASTYDDIDQLLVVGLQYSNINETEFPIFTWESGTSTNKWNIFVYQDKVVVCTVDNVSTDSSDRITNVEGNSCEIFFPMAENLDDSNSSNYHQLAIYKKFEKRDGNNYWKGIYVYIDGILEGAFKSFNTVHTEYTQAVFYPGNYYVNEVEYHCFRHSDTSVARTWFNDNDFIGLYYTYYEKLLGGAVSETDKTLYDAFSSFIELPDNFIKTNASVINNIAMASKVPVLLLSFTDTDGKINDTHSGFNQDNFKSWVSGVYSEMDELELLKVTAQWADGGGEGLKTITKQGETAPANFELTLQGSSTMSYRCKNFELYAPESNDVGKCIYSPNFNSNDPASFLPEESFTLKADVVDSSHTNNNAMGKFINDISTPFALARQGKAKYGPFIKNCLTGFPVLLFIHTRYKEAKEAADVNIENYYFFGIYNFNLGRKSYFNLGYKDLTKLETLGLSNGFKIYEIAPEDNGILNSVAAAEVQGNNKFFDFSQYNETILYEISDGDETVMFGDFVDGVSGSSGEYANAKSKISSFVRRVARAGGYAFEAVGKNFSNSASDSYGYDDKYSAADKVTKVPKNQVPNYKYQAVRSKQGTANNYDFSLITDPAREQDLKELLVQDETGESKVTVGLDYAALCEYYTICMAFGLVDSVQKNLNIKSWNNGDLFYPAFYDMDTCLGVSNSGSKISYFAFSDYWESLKDSNGNLKAANVWRDYSPLESSEDAGSDDSSSAFFDVPSSYLFAIAKYAYSILHESDLVMHPSNLWALWRNSSRNESWNNQNEKQKGCLATADYFMNTYYDDHLANVPKSAFNYNYRYKYFVIQDGSVIYDEVNFPKFYGRKHAYTLDWLKGRLHILDAYFNLNQLSDVMNPGLNIAAPSPDTQYVDSRNKDIYVLKDIFSTSANGNQYANLSTTISVQAKPYSPLIVKGSNRSSRYILPADGNLCKLSISTDGNQFALLGGSSLWTYLSSINPFITAERSLIVHSDYFTNLTGTSGTCNTWNIQTPSLKTISLTGNSGYSGNLVFSSESSIDNFPNLKTINISGTKIDLTVNNEAFTTLTATDMKGGSINISNVSTLSSVSITGQLTGLNIPAWKKDITLPTSGTEWGCTDITITNDTRKYPGSTLTIKGNTTLKTLAFSGFEKVVITGCPKLEIININDTNVLKTLDLIAPTQTDNSAKTFRIGGTNKVADLSKQSVLGTLRLQRAQMETVKLPARTINLSQGAFQECYSLKYISGTGTYNITSYNTFAAAYNWTYRQKADEANTNPVFAKVFVGSGCTNLEGTFYISNLNTRGSIDYLAAKYFLTECTKSAGNVTNIKNLFRNQNIEYSLETGWNEYKEERCSLPLDKFPKVTDAHSAFYDNQIDFWNKYMFKGLGSKSTVGVRTGGSCIIGERTARNPSNSETSRGMYRTYGSSTKHVLYSTIDALEFFNIVDLGFRTWNSDDAWWFLIEEDETYEDTATGLRGFKQVDTISLHDFFFAGRETLPFFTSCSSLEFFEAHNLDFTEWFTEGMTKIKLASSGALSLKSVFHRGTYNIKGMEELFYNVNVSSIYASLSGNKLDTETNGRTGRVNMATFINWGIDETDVNRKKAILSKLTDLFGVYNERSIVFPKTITYTDFQEVWAHILKYATNLTRINEVFNNCIITGVTPEEFSLVDEETYSGESNSKISNIDLLFANCYFRNSLNGGNVAMAITHDFFKYLPSISQAVATFENTKWKNPIPFDFFRKRYKTEQKVYISEGSRRIEVKLIGYDYNRTLGDIHSCFKGIVMEKSASFNPEADYNKGSFQKARLVTVSGDTETVRSETEYYTNLTTSKKTPITQPTEITDAENIQSHYVQRFTTAGKNKTNNIQNYTCIDSSGCFCSPDVLYGMNTGCNIENVFSANTGDVNVFTGVIPDHLFKNCMNASFTGALQGLGITPKYYNEYQTTETNSEGEDVVITHKFYYYVPVNFTNATSLSGCFNFKFIAPPVEASTKYYYVVFLNSENGERSLPVGITSLGHSLPGTDTGGTSRFPGGVCGLESGFPRFFDEDSGIRYAVMGTPKEEVKEGKTEFSGMDWGLDLKVYNKLKLDNIYNPAICFVSVGNLIREGTLITWNKANLMARNDSFFIRLGHGDWSGLSYNAKIEPPLLSNSQYMRGVGSQINGCVVNVESIKSYDSSKYSSYGGYYENIKFYPEPEAGGK